MNDYATITRKDGAQERVPVELERRPGYLGWRVDFEGVTLQAGDSISMPSLLPMVER